ncbi:PorV/PorQ family protein [Chitinophagaceae bacterium MMS25-I14]
MKNFSTKAALAICLLGVSVQAFAGNKDRSGQAGATELLLNPWAATGGVFGINTSNVVGIEAMKGNIAGLADADKTEVGFSYTMLLKGSNIGIENLGISQKLGNLGVIGLNIMSMSFGDIKVTDYNNPAGFGTYKPQFLNFQVGFGKEFSQNIRAGVAATYVSEQINSIHASGAAFDVGVQYVSGVRKNFHFGVTLRNIGTNMRFSGNGFTVNSEAPESQTSVGLYTMNQEFPSDKFQMPTYLNIGVGYDFYLDANKLEHEDDKPKHRATVMGSFQSNSFNNDYLGIAAEYAFMETFMLRAGYRYEKNIGNSALSTTMYTGISAGVTIQHQIGDKGPRLALDYSYKPTQRPNNGVHAFSLRIMRR